MDTTTNAAPAPATLHPGGFEPSRYLTKLSRRARNPEGGWQTIEQDYMEVKWRLLWLRTEYPSARIETQMTKHEDGLAIFRAHVALPSGAESSGWGSETADDWKDYIEKAETKALGRALAALGFGTQFCEDYDFSGGRDEQVVDAPVAPPRGAEITRIPVEARRAEQPRPAAVRETGPRETGAPSAASRATEPQIKAIYAIARSSQSMDEAQTAEWCRARYGVPPAELTRRQASELIDALKLGQAS